MNTVNNLSQITSLLRQFDPDLDGKITENDFILALRKLGLGTIGDNTARAAFKKFDRNLNGKLDINDAVMLISSLTGGRIGGTTAGNTTAAPGTTNTGGFNQLLGGVNSALSGMGQTSNAQAGGLGGLFGGIGNALSGMGKVSNPQAGGLGGLVNGLGALGSLGGLTQATNSQAGGLGGLVNGLGVLGSLGGLTQAINPQAASSGLGGLLSGIGSAISRQSVEAGDAPVQIDTINKQLDIDGNGVITVEDFLVFANKAGLGSLNEAGLREAFKKLDKNQNGKLDPDEVTGLFTKLQQLLA